MLEVILSLLIGSTEVPPITFNSSQEHLQVCEPVKNDIYRTWISVGKDQGFSFEEWQKFYFRYDWREVNGIRVAERVDSTCM